MFRTLALSVLLFVACMWLFSSYCTVNDQPLHKADAIIILGMHVNNDGTLPSTLNSRLDMGLSLWKANMAPFIIVSGGNVANRHVEALAMSQYLQDHGVPAEVIIPEMLARDTQDNARYSTIIMQDKHFQSAIVVTSQYHSRRAKLMFALQSIPVQIVATPYPDDIGFGGKMGALLHELRAICYAYNFLQ